MAADPMIVDPTPTLTPAPTLSKKRTLAELGGLDDVLVPVGGAATRGDESVTLQPFKEQKAITNRKDALHSLEVIVLEDGGALGDWYHKFYVMVLDPCSLVSDELKEGPLIKTNDVPSKNVPLWKRSLVNDKWLEFHVWGESIGKSKDAVMYHYELSPPAVLRPGQKLEVTVREFDLCKPMDLMILRNVSIKTGAFEPKSTKVAPEKKEATPQGTAAAAQPVSDRPPVVVHKVSIGASNLIKPSDDDSHAALRALQPPMAHILSAFPFEKQLLAPIFPSKVDPLDFPEAQRPKIVAFLEDQLARIEEPTKVRAPIVTLTLLGWPCEFSIGGQEEPLWHGNNAHA